MVVLAGVIGHPIAHSLSPALHTRWLEAFGIEGTYEAVPCVPDGFAAKVASLREAGWAGLNVTLPFKAEALALADAADETARRVGAANTLVFGEEGITATNTDAPAFASALRAALHETRGGAPCPPASGGTAISDGEGGATLPKSALVLGAGGTAPAILAALEGMGVPKLRLTNRTADKAATLAERFGTEVVPWADRHDAADTDLLVNATALGLPGNPPLDMDLSALPARAVVADCVYARGCLTPLATAARTRGLAAFDGLPMLVRQAVPGFAAWYGRTPTDLADAEAYLRALP